MADPSHAWTRQEQIAFAVTKIPRVGDPGKVFAYSDTGYIVLGEIIEGFIRWGWLISTVSDLTSFIQALFNDQIVTKASRESMLTEEVAPGFGRGIYSVEVAGSKSWGHAGFWGTACLYFPDTGVSLIVMINFADPQRSSESVDFRTILDPLYAAVKQRLKL